MIIGRNTTMLSAAMPETSIYKDGDLYAGEGNVNGSSRKTGHGILNTET